jgi:hypothetical protein
LKEVEAMTAKQIAFVALLTLAACAGAAYAQPPGYPPPPPPDQYGDQYNQPLDSYSDQTPPDQYSQVPDGGSVDISYFYNNLAAYGHWVERGSYGWVWLPFGVRVSWRPYTLGQWVLTDYGWTWVSTEPFGWATYHYGRWVDDPDYGWAWVPGYDWGPAWVAWRSGAGYIGWAPLPPEVGFRAGFGLDFGGIDLNVRLGATHYCFVQERSFLSANVATYVAPPARNVTIINNTTNITNYTVVNNRVVNQGVPVQHLEQVTGRPVQRLQVAAVKSGPAPRSGQVRGSQLTVFQPTIVKKSTPPPPPPARARAAGADLQQKHQQESQKLVQQQAQERTSLQQIHQREVKTAASNPQPPAQPVNSPTSRRQPPQPPSDQQRSQPQATPPRKPAAQPSTAANSQQLAQRHQDELKALEQQHQREQQQLDARHRLEQQSAQRQPPPQQQSQRKGEQQQPQKQPDKKNQQKPPANPPPPPPSAG